jgi:hypothetical protein
MLQMVPVTGLSDDALQKLQNYCVDKFWASVTARNNQIQGMYQRWLDNYAGRPLQTVRTTPFYKASNFVPQLIRMHTDILSARILGFIFGTKPLWRPRTLVTGSSISNETLLAIGEWMEGICMNGIEFYEPVDTAIFLTCKCGTQVLKSVWANDSVWAGSAGAQPNRGPVEVREEGLEFDVVPFDDFFPYPVTARTSKQTICNFHRLRFAKEEVEYRKSLRIWDERASELLLRLAGRTSEGNPRDADANLSGIALTVDVIRPYTVIEGWIKYELSPGRISSLVVTFNPYSKTRDGLLRVVYDWTPRAQGVFTDFRIMPRENLYWGYSIPEILEQSQEEQAQIHNARRDANLISNVPGWKKKRLADVGNPGTEWYPGKVFELDAMDDLDVLQFPVSYNSLIEEENALLQLSERYTGISVAMQGFGAGQVGKRGVYSSMGTMALLAEGNKRLDIYTRRLRRPFHSIGSQIFQAYKNFKTGAPEWNQYGRVGELLQQAFSLNEPEGFRGFFFDIGASEASANKEVDRQNLLLMANTMSAYYKEIMSLVPMVAQAPPGSPFQELGLQVLDGARDLANRILFAFDVYDRTKLIPDVRAILGGQQPPPRPQAADEMGLPQAEGGVQPSQLQDLSRAVGQVAGGAGQAPGGGIPGFGSPEGGAPYGGIM